MISPFITHRLSLRVDGVNPTHITATLFDDGGNAGQLKMSVLGFSTLILMFDCDAETYRNEPEKYMGKTYEWATDW